MLYLGAETSTDVTFTPHYNMDRTPRAFSDWSKTLVLLEEILKITIFLIVIGLKSSFFH